MADTSMQDFFARQAAEAGEQEPGHPRGRRRKIRRILLASGVTAVVLAGAVAGSGYLVINHLASSVHRIPNVFTGLTAAEQPVMPAATRSSMTVLLTGSVTTPAVRGGTGPDGSSTAPEAPSGLIALVHLNAGQQGGAVVSLPPNAVVTVPGHGREQLVNALSQGGPALLIRSVEHLTHVRIDHYSVLDLPNVVKVVDALGGVNVDVPFEVTSTGLTFQAGINHLSGQEVLPYVRQPGVSEIGRALLQQNLIRTILIKSAHELTAHPTSDYGLLHAVAGALSVDSNFSNSRLEHFALSLRHLSGKDSAFVSAPTTNGSPTAGGSADVYLNRSVTSKLWTALRHDSVAAFAKRFPDTVTPGAPG